MVDRRRATRYRFCTSAPADITILQDAVLESFDGKRAWIVTSEPAVPGDELVVLFRAPGTRPTRYAMRVCSSTPTFADRVTGYRVELVAAGVTCTADLTLLAHL